jgi:hypothetical protein
MLGIPLRYVLKHPLNATADLAADPFEALTTVREYIAEEREPRRPQYPYQHDHDWEQRLHEHIGVSWPCEVTSEFRGLWSEVIGERFHCLRAAHVALFQLSEPLPPRLSLGTRHLDQLG